MEAPLPPFPLIARRWDRLLAFILDWILLAIVCAVVGTCGFDFFAAAGDWARVVGLALSVGYFTWMVAGNSTGQTTGQSWRRIRVVTLTGERVAMAPAFWRALVLWGPIMLNGAFLPVRGQAGYVAEAAVFAVIAFAFLANFYLALFNRRDGRALHDLAAGTIVIEAGGVGAPPSRSVWRGHWVILAAWAGGATLLAVGMLHVFWPALQEPLGIAERVMTMPNVRGASVDLGTSFDFSGGVSAQRHTCAVHAILRRKPADYASEAETVARVVLATDPRILSMDNLTIALSYGYNLGIWSWSVSRIYSRPPAQWPHRPIMVAER